MLHGKGYASCPECAASNKTGRQTCRQCGHALSKRVTGAETGHVPPAPRAVPRAEIAELLDRAELFVCHDDPLPEADAASVPAPPAELSRAQRRLLGARHAAKSRT